MSDRPTVASQPGDWRAWLSRARGNLARARQPKPPEGFWEDLCFDCEQAAEKAIKAVLVARGIRFRKVHDLEELFAEAQRAGVSVPADVRQTVPLSDFSIGVRYPGHGVPLNERDFQEALSMAEIVVSWAEGVLASEQRAHKRNL